MAKIQLWSEGYEASGDSCDATFHGEYECDTLQEAAALFKESLDDANERKTVHVEDLNFWGCRFFDNETDARKSCG